MTRISLLIVALFTAIAAHAANPTITWNANPEPDIAGYRLWCRSGGDIRVFDLGKVTVFDLTQAQCPVGETTTLTLTAYNLAGLESAESTAVQYFSDPTNPPPPAGTPYGKPPNPPKTPIARRD